LISSPESPYRYFTLVFQGCIISSTACKERQSLYFLTQFAKYFVPFAVNWPLTAESAKFYAKNAKKKYFEPFAKYFVPFAVKRPLTAENAKFTAENTKKNTLCPLRNTLQPLR
jgi:hypothetical protein